MTRMRPWAERLLLLLLLVVGVPALVEVSTRVVLRLSTGTWPQTRKSSAFRDRKVSTEVLFRRHPYLDLAPRSGGRLEIQRETMTLEGEGPQQVLMSFNSLGYRSPERPLTKPPGVLRVLCAGGSTTMDTLAAVDSQSWPWLLEEELAARGFAVEVWNAGVPGWTSLESLVSLAIRDSDLDPDVILLYQGVNDLQPAAHEPFDPQYEVGHAELLRRAMGFEGGDLAWYERSVALEKLRDVVAPEPQWQPLHSDPAPVRTAIPEAAVATFERNLRAFAAIGRLRGAEVVLMTSMIRIRAAHAADDEAYLAWWLPWLEPSAAPNELERLNEVIRQLGAEQVVRVADAAAAVPWGDQDFGDPMHIVSRDELVRFLGDQIAPLLAARASGAGGPL